MSRVPLVRLPRVVRLGCRRDCGQGLLQGVPPWQVLPLASKPALLCVHRWAVAPGVAKDLGLPQELEL